MHLHLYKWPSFVPFLWGSKTKSLQIVTAVMKLKDATLWEESYDQPRQHINKQSHYFVNKNPSSQGYGFSSSHVWMRELNCKESWVLKNWCFWTVVLEKTLESPLECSPWGLKQSGTTEQLNWTELSVVEQLYVLIFLVYLLWWKLLLAYVFC